MRILFTTQGESLNLFNALRVDISKKTAVEKTGFVISDSWSYLEFLKKYPGFEQEGHLLLKEWDITKLCSNKPDLELLRSYEEKIGAEPGLYGAIIADRRLYFGKDCTYTQDYSRRFTDDELLSILQAALIKVDALFDELQPDLVVGFICVTMVDYLVYLFARARGIKYLNLRPTRIADRFAAASTICDPAPEFVESYHKCLTSGSEYLEISKSHLKKVREKQASYEGVIKASSAPATKVNYKRRNIVESFFHVMRNYLTYRKSISATDNHVVHPLRALFYSAVNNRYRAMRMRASFRDKYINKESLKQQRYMFFPLHTEPEVQLLVYGRPFINQIEMIRQLAISMPADMILVIKEHPWMVGKRSMSAYKKILDIPRVHLVDPSENARDLIEGADIVSVITGTVALEAAMIGKPVVSFGDGPFNALPDTMVKQCKDMRHLPELIKDLLAAEKTEAIDKYLECYIAAAYENSESINFYSVLLKKKDVYSLREASYEYEISKLADFILRRSKLETIFFSGNEGGAAW